jgi:hypothetical protein
MTGFQMSEGWDDMRNRPKFTTEIPRPPTPQECAALKLVAATVQWRFPIELMSWSVPIPETVDREALAIEARQAFVDAYDSADGRPHVPYPIQYWSALLGDLATVSLDRELFDESKMLARFFSGGVTPSSTQSGESGLPS